MSRAFMAHPAKWPNAKMSKWLRIRSHVITVQFTAYSCKGGGEWIIRRTKATSFLFYCIQKTEASPWYRPLGLHSADLGPTSTSASLLGPSWGRWGRRETGSTEHWGLVRTGESERGLRKMIQAEERRLMWMMQSEWDRCGLTLTKHYSPYCRVRPGKRSWWRKHHIGKWRYSYQCFVHNFSRFSL